MKNNVLKNATDHFREKIGGDMVKVHVPEWKADIWFKRTNTLAEESKIISLAQKGETIEALVETLIVKARNEDGSKMFKPVEKQVFMNEIDPNVLIRVVGEINALSAQANLDETVKN